MCIYWSRRCRLVQINQKNSFICLWFFFYVAVVWLCINVHSFNETYLQLWYLKMYKGYIVYIDLLKFHCHGWLTLVAMESSIIHHHLGRNKNISICVKIEQKHNKVCTLFYSKFCFSLVTPNGSDFRYNLKRVKTIWTSSAMVTVRSLWPLEQSCYKVPLFSKKTKWFFCYN